MTKITKLGVAELSVTVEFEGKKMELPWRNLIVGVSRWRNGALVIQCIHSDERHWGELALTPFGVAQIRGHPGFHYEQIPEEIRKKLQLTPVDASKGVGDFWISSPFSF